MGVSRMIVTSNRAGRGIAHAPHVLPAVVDGTEGRPERPGERGLPPAIRTASPHATTRARDAAQGTRNHVTPESSSCGDVDAPARRSTSASRRQPAGKRIGDVHERVQDVEHRNDRRASGRAAVGARGREEQRRARDAERAADVADAKWVLSGPRVLAHRRGQARVPAGAGSASIQDRVRRSPRCRTRTRRAPTTRDRCGRARDSPSVDLVCRVVRIGVARLPARGAPRPRA